MKKYTDVESQVEYGLDRIDPNRKIELPLQDFLYAYQTIGEFVRFFHQPMHFETLEDVEKFIGNKNKGGLHLLSEVYYKKFYDLIPEDIMEMFSNGDFDNPDFPFYYKP